MNDLLDHPAVQAGVLPFIVALLVALPLARTRYLAAGTGSGDEHLRAADFFNVAEFPEMTYKSTRFNFAGDKIESVEGNLTLLGVSRPVKLVAASIACGPNPFSKKDMCGGDFTGSLKRSDFGIKFAVPAISDEVKLMIAVEAYKD